MMPNDASLLERQDALQAEAMAVLADLDLFVLLRRFGTPTHTGSSALGLMVRRDIDVTTVCPSLDVEAVRSTSAGRWLSTRGSGG